MYRTGGKAHCRANARERMPTPVDDSREQLLKRWLQLMVERSSLEQLSSRPISERLKELELLLDAAGDAGVEISGGPPAASEERRPGFEPGTLAAELDRLLAEQRATGTPFSLVLVGGGRDWYDALAPVAGTDCVFKAAEGTSAVVLSGLAGPNARAAVDRLRASAWRELGADGRLPEVGLATCPADGGSAGELMAAAQWRLMRRALGDESEERLEPVVATATVTPFHSPARA
jgi:hypothetical protein